MLDAAKTRPSRTPRTIAPMLNSFGASVAGTYGENDVPGVVRCVGMVMAEYEVRHSEGARLGAHEALRQRGRRRPSTIAPPTSRPSGTRTPRKAMHHATTPIARRHASANASTIG